MRKLISLMAVAACAGCAGPMGNLGRLFPDGASVTIKDAAVVVNMTGGTVTAKEISWVGTNGFPLVGSTTNALGIGTITPIPANAVILSK